MGVKMPQIVLVLIIAFLVLIGAIGFIMARLFRKATKERAFVRTGLGGQRVIMDGGAIVLPVFHEVIMINMNTLKLEVHRAQRESLITKDRLRVDIVAAFFVRVMPNAEAVANAAQTLGQRTLDPEALKQLVEDKFVDALRATAATMTMQQLQDARQQFVQGVQNAVSDDLLKNGLELESVSLTSLDQTSKECFNPNNAFDAEGLTRLTQETEQRRKERNEIEQDAEVAVREKNLNAQQRKLEIERQQEFLKLEQEQAISKQRASQNAIIAATEAEKKREAEQAKIQAEREINQATIEAERLVKEAEIQRDLQIEQKKIASGRELELANISKEQAMRLADQDRLIQVAKKSEEQSKAEAEAHQAFAEAVKAEEGVHTSREKAIAERKKEIAVIEAQQEAEKKAIEITVLAEAEKHAATHQAEATKIKAEADRIAFETEADGKRRINEAINTLSPQQIAMQVKLKLIDALPLIIEQSVEPLKQIDSIRIMQVEGLTKTGGGSAPLSGGETGTNLAEQVVSAALSYRAQQPLIDSILSEVGLQGGSLTGLTQPLLDTPQYPVTPSEQTAVN